MDNSKTYAKARQALNDLFSDISVPRDVTRADLVSLRDEIDVMIETLPRE